MSSSVPNPTRLNTNTAPPSLPISLEGLRANEDIAMKQAYILRHGRALLNKRRPNVEHLAQDISHYERAFGRLRPKPLDTERDTVERSEQQLRVVKRYIELQEQLAEIRKENVMIMETLQELTTGMEPQNRAYTEWVLMPSLVWNLVQLG